MASAAENGVALALAGDALAAGADGAQTAEHVARLAVEATGALASLLWLSGEGRPLELVASFGVTGVTAPLADAGDAAERALRDPRPVSVEEIAGKLPAGAEVSATMQLGHPPVSQYTRD